MQIFLLVKLLDRKKYFFFNFFSIFFNFYRIYKSGGYSPHNLPPSLAVGGFPPAFAILSLIY